MAVGGHCSTRPAFVPWVGLDGLVPLAARLRLPPKDLLAPSSTGDCLLKGTQPADLPIAAPRAFVVDRKTAEALGLILPQHLLLQATQVIQ